MDRQFVYFEDATPIADKTVPSVWCDVIFYVWYFMCDAFGLLDLRIFFRKTNLRCIIFLTKIKFDLI